MSIDIRAMHEMLVEAGVGPSLHKRPEEKRRAFTYVEDWPMSGMDLYELAGTMREMAKDPVSGYTIAIKAGRITVDLWE